MTGFLAIGMLFSATLLNAQEEEQTMKTVKNQAGETPQVIVAIEDVCAWPNLTALPDGTIVAAIHNQPSHLKQPADVECWASEDGGQTWNKRGTPAPRDNPNVARGNVAAGLAGNGDLIVISSGWSDPTAKEGRGRTLPILVSRSTDGGRTWDVDDAAFPGSWPEIARRGSSPEGYLVPFGDILSGDDGRLHVGLYSGNRGAAFVYSSRDDGKTWGEPANISADTVVNEPAFLHLGEGRWLCAGRRAGLDLYHSENDAQSWRPGEKLTGSEQHPGHLMRMKDGTILLSYGNRQDPKGVDVRFSDDEGKSWSEPFRVLSFEGDGGYPSSVQLPDGRIVTAYYAKRIPGFNRYHMGVVIWDPEKTRGQ